MGENIKCRLLGHSWLYKDVSHSVKADGEKYFYTAVRKCERCDKHQYKYADWVNEEFVSIKDKEEMVFRNSENDTAS